MTLIKPYFILANCLLLVFMAYLGVSGVYDMASANLQTMRPQPLSDTQEAASSNSSRRPLAHYHSIDKRNLFDIKKTTSRAPEPEEIKDLEPTELKLRLWGTVYGTSDGSSYAVIEDLKARSQNLYRRGDTVQDATVKMILREKVILRVNDKDEILEMEKMQTASSSSERPAFRPSAPPSREAAPRTQKISVERSQIDEALANVNDLMQQVRIMPHFDNGQPDGFRLSGIKTNSLVRKMGLRNGDIITGVNGEPIQTMDDALGFYKQLSGASNVSVQMKRRGRERTIEYSIK